MIRSGIALSTQLSIDLLLVKSAGPVNNKELLVQEVEAKARSYINSKSIKSQREGNVSDENFKNSRYPGSIQQEQMPKNNCQSMRKISITFQLTTILFFRRVVH